MNDETEILWATFPIATRRASLSRGTLYNLIKDGLIKSRVIRRKNGRGAGLRLIDLKSLDEFIENSPSEVSDEVRARNRKAAGAMFKVKAAKREEQAARSRRAVQREAKAA